MTLQDSDKRPVLKELSSNKKALQLANLDEFSWKSSLVNGDVSAALKKLEVNYDPIGSQLAARLWWIRCQLHLGHVPTSALTAPLENLFPEVLENKELRPLAASTYLQAGLKLLQKKQTRLAVLTFDRAAELVKESEVFSEDEDTAIITFYRDVLQQELEEARNRRETKEYIERTEQRLEEQEVFLEKRFAKPEPVEQVLASDPDKLSSKSILAEAEKVSSASKERLSTINANQKSRKKILGIIAAAICFLAVSFFAWKTIYTETFEESLQSTLSDRPLDISDSIEASDPSQPDIPLLQPKSSVPRESDLASAKNKFDLQVSEADTSLQNERITSINERIEAIGSKQDPESSNNEQQQVANISPVQIDSSAMEKAQATVLPGEEDELVSIGSTNRIDSNTEIKMTPIPKAKMPNVAGPVSVGSSQRKAVLPSPKAPIESTKRIPRRDKDPVASMKGRKALDGSPLRSYEVQNFNPPLTYRTLTATDVLNTPSIFAKPVARLNTNTHVHVTKKMGQWLELRSTGGKIGYIFSQDAGPL